MASSAWLSKLETRQIVVVSNTRDPMLFLARLQNKTNLLGQEDDDTFIGGSRAPHVDYVDASRVGVEHRYFVVGSKADEKKERLRDILFGPLYGGDIPDWTKFRREHPEARVFTFRNNP